MSRTYTHKFDTPLYKGSVTIPTGLFIGGQFVEPVEKGTIDVVNPVTGKVITPVSVGTAKDVDIAVDAARQAYKTSWGLKVLGFERGRLLNKLADLVEQHTDELAALEALDCGKFFLHAKGQDLKVAVDLLRYFAGWADKNQGQTMETNALTMAYTRHEPVGVCALIVPWNFPMMSYMGKLAPALATGNAVVLKPAEITPLTSFKLAELIIEAGFPPGVINIVVGYGDTVGQALADHPRIDKLSFTGSTAVGRKILKASSESNLKRVTLELGGKSPTMIFDDADLDQSLKWTSRGIFHHSGQMCTAGSRIFVQESIYDEFMKGFVTIAKSIQQGDGFKPETHQGPSVSEAQMKRVLGYIESGKADGATVVTGGGRLGNSGFFVQPTVFTNVKPDMKIVREEIFGPVCVIIKFKTEEEIIEMANDTVYGLSAAVFTQNINRAIRVANAMESGQVFINSAGMGNIAVPLGGVKQSGIGKELGQAALEAYTTVKAIHVNHGVML